MLPLQKHSYNYPLLALTTLHVLITAVSALISAQLITMAFGTTVKWPELYVMGWIIICATAGRWFVSLGSLFVDYRRPIREESEILSHAILEIEARTGAPVEVDIYIEDTKIINAAASGTKTWIISAGALQQLNALEIAAVLAHEQGHHRSGDTRMRAAMTLCYWVNKYFAWPGYKIMSLIKRLTFFGWLSLMVMISGAFLLNRLQPLLIIIALLLPYSCFRIVYQFLRPVDLFIRRRTEYKQDAYAASLGLGPALRSVCLKLAKQFTARKNSWWHVTFNNTHPIIHDRIRKLDQLSEGKNN